MSITFLTLLYIIPVVFGTLHLLNPNPEKMLIRFDELLSRSDFFRANLLFYTTQFLVFAYITVLLILTTRRLFQALKKPILEREKNSVIMILIGFLPLSLILLTVTITYIPFSGGSTVFLVASSLWTVYFILLMFHFGFFEGKTFVRVFFIYPVYIGLMALLYTVFFRELNMVLSDLFNVSIAFLLSMEIIIFLSVLSPIIRMLESRLGDAVVPVSSTIHEGIKNVQSRLAQVIDLFALSTLLERIFIQDLKLKHFFFLMEDEHTNSFRSLTQDLERETIRFPKNGELSRRLCKEKKVINIQQIALSWGGGDELRILDSYKITQMLPIFTGGKMTGICLFGELGVARTWHPPEIEELELLGAGLAVVIERCNTHSQAIEIEKKQARIEKFAVLHEITSGVAHEIRNPMSIISTSAETIATKDLPEEERKKLAGYIQEETSRVSRLLNNILSIAPQKRDIHNMSTDVKQVISHTFELVASHAQKKNLTLRIIIKAERIIALIDKEALTQVCINILLNAIEATPCDGYVLAIINKSGKGQVEIRIANSGTPISEEIRKKIFDPFITTKPNGTGLGLSVSQRLIKEAGGSLQLIDDDKETVFQVILPAPAHAAGVTENRK